MATSFKTDIVPLFTSVDIEHMSRLEVPLDDYAYMSQPDNAAGVYDQVSNGTMPPSASGEQPCTLMSQYSPAAGSQTSASCQ